jgi:hypothetical protein
MLKIASKFALDIFPSVIATIIGAYIVNHYIVARPDAPTAAAAVSSASPKKADLKSDSRPAEKSADLGNTPEPGVRAKGISEKAVSDRAAIDRLTVEKSVVEKPTDKADKPAETASIPADTRRHPVAPRDKTAAKTAPVQPSVLAVEPVVAAPTTGPAVEAAIAPDRDANDLARAAIERLRGTPDGSRAPEAARLPDPPRVVAAPAAPSGPAPSLQPLPPPILVSTPPADTFDAATGSTRPSYPATARGDDPHRPTPPADIPDPRPLDLRADAIDQPHPREHTTVAEDVLSAAKSMFHSVLPNNSAK